MGDIAGVAVLVGDPLDALGQHLRQRPVIGQRTQQRTAETGGVPGHTVVADLARTGDATSAVDQHQAGCDGAGEVFVGAPRMPRIGGHRHPHHRIITRSAHRDLCSAHPAQPGFLAPVPLWSRRRWLRLHRCEAEIRYAAIVGYLSLTSTMDQDADRPESGLPSPSMDKLTGEQIAQMNLPDWRKLGQGLHARYLVDDFATGVGFVAAVGEAGSTLGHHPRVTIGHGNVDFELISDGVYRDDQGIEHVVAGVTQLDIDLARRITAIAAERAVDADPASITTIELALDTAYAATIAPVWAALLTGSTAAWSGKATSDDVRDPTGRAPTLWFQGTDEHETPRQRFHIDVWVAPEMAEQRIAAAVAAGGIIVDDSQAPSFTVIADQEGNKACVCTALPAAKTSAAASS